MPVRGIHNPAFFRPFPLPRFLILLGFVAMLIFSFAPRAQAQRGEGNLVNQPPQGISVDQIIQRFATKEKDFRAARARYTYRQSNIIQTLEGSTVDGEYRQDWDVNFDSHGKRSIAVTYAPAPTLSRISMTSEDTNDLQNVKTYGKSVPDLRSGKDENLFPRFTTYREQIDNVYWFPTYTTARDTLHFKGGDVDIRVIIKYTDYKRFGSETKILYDGQEIPESNPQPK